MRILHVTAGAANMFCGSCMRDNALAAELIRQGHDVVLMPVYTPTLTDEENVSDGRVFFGGISVYLQQKSAIFRYTPAFLDRLLFDNSWALRRASQKSIGVTPQFLGEMTVDMLKGETGPIAKEFRKIADWLRSEPKFDVICLPFTLLIAMAEPLRRASGGALIVCSLQGEDLFLEGLPEPYKSESKRLIKAALSHVDRFLAVSAYYAAFMSSYLDIPKAKLRVVPIGISLDGCHASPKPPRDVAKIGFFARIDPAKGLQHLCEAYRVLRHRPGVPATRLEIAGYMLPEHREFFEGEMEKMRQAGLGPEVAYHGALSREEKMRFLRDIDILCVPTEYVEPKGLFVLEALANGTPVVLPAHGAFPEILARAGGGILVEPNNSHALADSLQNMICDADRRAELAAQGAEGVRRYYSATEMAAAQLAAFV
ncbi:MAG: glycosyltransferase family 4 protein [Bryobacterales bacterium]|nr:glycosyltransferase family 4 protein [Bryobacterales bacterium]